MKNYVVRSPHLPDVRWDFDYYEEAREHRDKHPQRYALDLRIYKLQLVEVPDTFGDSAIHAANLFRNREG